MSLKSSLRKITPLRASTFEKYRKRLEDSTTTLEDNIAALGGGITTLEDSIAALGGGITILEDSIAALEQKSDAAFERTLNEIKHMDETMDKRIASIVEKEIRLIVAERFEKLEEDFNSQLDALQIKQDRVQHFAEKTNSIVKEILWAETFNRSISGSSWFKDAPLSPGRWAVGYPYLYALYRVLNEAQPKNILELGLGQSTSMISKYAAAFENVSHIVVEHDESWIDFYQAENNLPSATEIVRLGLEMKEMPFCERPVRMYSGFKNAFEDKKFDLISIDAPFGYDMKEYARIDTLGILPDSLSKSFTIMIDDYNRKGEQNMAVKLKETLTLASIEFSEGVYEGEKATLIICSKDQAFLTSL